MLTPIVPFSAAAHVAYRATLPKLLSIAERTQHTYSRQPKKTQQRRETQPVTRENFVAVHAHATSQLLEKPCNDSDPRYLVKYPPRDRYGFSPPPDEALTNLAARDIFQMLDGTTACNDHLSPLLRHVESPEDKSVGHVGSPEDKSADPPKEEQIARPHAIRRLSEQGLVPQSRINPDGFREFKWGAFDACHLNDLFPSTSPVHAVFRHMSNALVLQHETWTQRPFLGNRFLVAFKSLALSHPLVLVRDALRTDDANNKDFIWTLRTYCLDRSSECSKPASTKDYWNDPHTDPTYAALHALALSETHCSSSNTFLTANRTVRSASIGNRTGFIVQGDTVHDAAMRFSVQASPEVYSQAANILSACFDNNLSAEQGATQAQKLIQGLPASEKSALNQPPSRLLMAVGIPR